MGLPLKRADLQANAEAKLADAAMLLQNQRYSNAYYLAGYAVELALKACIALQFGAETIPDKKLVNDLYCHDLKKLVTLAGLTAELRDAQDANEEFQARWAIVAQWEEASRYDLQDPISAQQMLEAISNPQTGVFQWIKQHW
ncbi:MAG TPA: HEPN domain-containing protein [Rhizomicrobium sp.]|jgi:AbiV family abortive infection protein|nr:HEPN domain-containing protein [Rhizomicrobium sp.]